MEGIVPQLLELFWGALPTTIIVFFLFFFLRWALWQPLERALAQRQAATEGARKEAEQLLKETNDKLQQYEEALRHARAEIYREQEASRQVTLDERNQLVRQAREQANEMLRQARLEMTRDVEQAKKELEAESARLAELISQTLLQPTRKNPGGGTA